MDEVPRPLRSVASASRTVAAAKVSRTRRDAEQFALEFSQLYIDARPDTDMEAVLSEVASAQMSPAIRNFIASDLQGQQTLGAERRWDATRSQWIRSSVRPASGQPDRVNVEIAAAFVSDPFELYSWYKTRIDVVWADGHWKVIDLSAGDFGPDTSEELTPEQRKDYLTGPGWRQISPR
ncbi:hypothetical protein [Aeromicrobium sp. CF3.5]|uniref:hypothetical protein n=1 Tax=Aeromicrobium sp. CF3.5 TaxID=3373078 RepID=UPI003EE57C9F